MWNDLMRRWMELAFWWVPGQKDSNGNSRDSAPEPTASQPNPPEQPGSSPQPKPEPEPEPKPEPEPVPEPDPAPTSHPEPKPMPEESQSNPSAEATTAAAGAGVDLTDIKGVGPAMAKRLEKLGISSVLELADADATSLTEQLKADGAVVSEAKVAGWIDSARG